MKKSKGMNKMAKGGSKMMKARGGKMAKGYAKGGSKMMKAMGGKMAMRPTNAGRMGAGTRARPMGAMKGKMAKGYAKGGSKMMKANKGNLADIRKMASMKGYKLVKNK